MSFPTSDGYIFLHTSEITYVKSDDIYSYIHNGPAKYFTTLSLKNISEILPQEQFIKCHRSYIVNIDKVFKLIKTANYMLTMENGDEVPVARGKKSEILKTIIPNSKY